MPSDALMHFAGTWSDAAQAVVRDAIESIEPLHLAESSTSFGAPWQLVREELPDLDLYFAHRLALPTVLTERTPEALAEQIRRQGDAEQRTHPPLVQLVYESRATDPMRPDDLRALMKTSRANNKRLGITGLLLYKSSRFLQVLEGDSAAVRSLYATIRADERHHDVHTVLTNRTHRRTFAEWSMGLENLDEIEWARDDRISAYLDDGSLSTVHQPLADLLEGLERFRTG